MVFDRTMSASQYRRSKILEHICSIDPGFGKKTIQSIQHSTLELLYSLYDTEAFNGTLHQKYSVMRLSLSSRMLSSAGKFIHQRKWTPQLEGEIRMSSDILFRLDVGPFHLNGLEVQTPQEAFLVVFEHELIHAYEFAIAGYTSHDQYFKSLAFNIFGHTKSTHQLPTRAQESTSIGIRIGTRVSFRYHGETLKGYVTYIGKTLSVMVPSFKGKYIDNFGKRYNKYRVSPTLATPIK